MILTIGPTSLINKGCRTVSTVNAFIVEAIEEKFQRIDAVESVSESEARIAADFSRIV